MPAKEKIKGPYKYRTNCLSATFKYRKQGTKVFSKHGLWYFIIKENKNE
jgi:hypothetical protein